MNRRKLLSFIGLAPVAVATGAVAATQSRVSSGGSAEAAVDILARRHIAKAFNENREVHTYEGARRILDVASMEDEIVIESVWRNKIGAFVPDRKIAFYLPI